MTSAALLIDGELREALSGRTFPCMNPATGRKVADIAEADAADVDLAVAAARRALAGAWSRLRPSDRGRLLRRLASLVETHAESLAALDTEDVGRPIRDTRNETRTSIPETLDFFGGAADKLRGHTLPVGPEFHSFTCREPWGVVGAITSWNYPLSNAVLKLAPALAAGNTLVLKPAEESPRSALALGTLCLEAGIPPGVVNVVPGPGPTAGAALARHRGVDRISFTGSTEVGRLILVMAAQSNLKPVDVELGGKSPCIVFADCDLQRVVDAAVFSVFFNQGQTCSAATRLLVDDAIERSVIDLLIEKAQAIRVGDPMHENTEMGPLASRQQYEKVRHYVELGVLDGATLAAGGRPPDDPALDGGCFWLPTVFTDVAPQLRIANEEIFGPVLTVMRFRDEAEAVSLANQVEYGLAASVWTRDLERAHRLVARIDAGMIWINTMLAESPTAPAGGFKSSGFGKENGMEAMEQYTRLKTIWIDLAGKRAPWPPQ